MMLLRYRDLVARGIVRNRMTLKRRIEKDNFPVGRMTGPNERTWTEEEVDAWIGSRPIEGPKLKGAAKANRDRARATTAA
jgi:predicted DNA-binding transcriptional regulator AlpA